MKRPVITFRRFLLCALLLMFGAWTKYEVDSILPALGGITFNPFSSNQIYICPAGGTYGQQALAEWSSRDTGLVTQCTGSSSNYVDEQTINAALNFSTTASGTPITPNVVLIGGNYYCAQAINPRISGSTLNAGTGSSAAILNFSPTATSASNRIFYLGYTTDEPSVTPTLVNGIPQFALAPNPHLNGDVVQLTNPNGASLGLTGFSANTNYYVVNLSLTGSQSPVCNLAATPNGAPIASSGSMPTLTMVFNAGVGIYNTSGQKLTMIGSPPQFTAGQQVYIEDTGNTVPTGMNDGWVFALQATGTANVYQIFADPGLSNQVLPSGNGNTNGFAVETLCTDIRVSGGIWNVPSGFPTPQQGAFSCGRRGAYCTFDNIEINDQSPGNNAEAAFYDNGNYNTFENDRAFCAGSSYGMLLVATGDTVINLRVNGGYRGIGIGGGNNITPASATFSADVISGCSITNCQGCAFLDAHGYGDIVSSNSFVYNNVSTSGSDLAEVLDTGATNLTLSGNSYFLSPYSSGTPTGDKESVLIGSSAKNDTINEGSGTTVVSSGTSTLVGGSNGTATLTTNLAAAVQAQICSCKTVLQSPMQVHGYVKILGTDATNAIFFQVLYTDENGTSQTATIPAANVTSGTVGTYSTQIGPTAGVYQIPPFPFISGANQTITVRVHNDITGGTLAYNVMATIQPEN